MREVTHSYALSDAGGHISQAETLSDRSHDCSVKSADDLDDEAGRRSPIRYRAILIAWICDSACFVTFAASP